MRLHTVEALHLYDMYWDLARTRLGEKETK